MIAAAAKPACVRARSGRVAAAAAIASTSSTGSASWRALYGCAGSPTARQWRRRRLTVGHAKRLCHLVESALDRAQACARPATRARRGCSSRIAAARLVAPSPLRMLDVRRRDRGQLLAFFLSASASRTKASRVAGDGRSRLAPGVRSFLKRSALSATSSAAFRTSRSFSRRACWPSASGVVVP